MDVRLRPLLVPPAARRGPPLALVPQVALSGPARLAIADRLVGREPWHLDSDLHLHARVATLTLRGKPLRDAPIRFRGDAASADARIAAAERRV